MPNGTELAPAAPWAERAWEKLRGRSARSIKRLVRPALLRRLDHLNRTSTLPVVKPGGPVISLTSHGDRVAMVHYTLESIAQGSLLPSRLVLWLGHDTLEHGLPDGLRRLVARGLEVHGTCDLGPHTKYFPQVRSQDRPTVPLVTVDDDILYPRYWLAALDEHAQRHPGAIACWRAHEIKLQADQRLAPYAGWRGCRSTRPSPLHFLTGVSGVHYPVSMQQALHEAGDGFLQVCPRADDIWLNLVALRSGHPVAQVKALGRRFFELPGTREMGLARSNVQGGGNDRQLADSYTVADLAQLAGGPMHAPWAGGGADGQPTARTAPAAADALS